MTVSIWPNLSDQFSTDSDFSSVNLVKIVGNVFTYKI